MLVVDWQAASEVYPLTVKMLALSHLRYWCISGLVVSVGGLTESIVRHSGASLITFLSTADGMHA